MLDSTTQFVLLSFVQSASSSCRQAVARQLQANGIGREVLVPSMDIDDREEGRLSTVEVPAGDTGKKAHVSKKLSSGDD